MLRITAVGVLMFSSTLALAERPSYNYIQGSYQQWDLDAGGIDADGDGFAVAGSVAFGDNWHAFADYASAELDSFLDVDLTTVGGGFHVDLSNRTDVYAELGLAKADVQFFGDDTGLVYRVGVRSMLNPNLELTASLGEMDFDDVDFGTEFAAGLWYTVSGNLAVGGEARFADDINRYGISARLYFDR